MAEARALELLAAMKQEHGIPRVTQPRVPGLSAELQERAGVTDAQAETLALWDPSPTGRGLPGSANARG